GRRRGAAVRLRPGRDLGHLAGGRAARAAPPPRGPTQPGLGRRRRTDALRHRSHERLPPAHGDRGHPPSLKGDTMSKGLTPGETLPDFELPDENGDLRRLSEIQGDDAMVLMLGRGEHCPRQRQHQREMLRFYEWSSVAFTQLVTVLPNDLHDVYRLKISTGAHWTYLADTD